MRRWVSSAHVYINGLCSITKIEYNRSMRLTITADQLKELSDDAFARLTGYIYESGDSFSELSADDIEMGTMLSLIERSSLVEAVHIYFLKSQEGGEWGLEMKTVNGIKQYKEKECVDALWEALKAVLDQSVS